VEIFGAFFMVTITNICQLNFKPFGSLKFLVENLLKNVFFSFFSTKEEKYMYLKKYQYKMKDKKNYN
jgi:hypothetical protein